MRIYLVLIAGLMFFAAAATAAGDDSDAQSRCAKLAEDRAAELLEDETYALEQRSTGPLEGSDVQRQLLEADVRAYREEVYRDCLRRAERAAGEGKAD